VKHKTVFTCQKCGCQSPKWMGKCPDCGAWNSMAEEAAAKPAHGLMSGGASRPVPICDVPAQSETRISCGIVELDRVLGAASSPVPWC
jgi:DNA repair protein RadA/Sms